MKSVLIVLLGLVLVFGTAEARRYHSHSSKHYDHTSDNHDCLLGNHAIELNGDNLLITAVDHEDFEIEITEDYELFIDGKEVALDTEQQVLVEAYHGQVYAIIDEAKDLGWEGARIGLQGAGIGLKAIKGVVKMIFTSYDEDDLERDMEFETDKIEARAEALEERAEDIEDMAYDLEDMFDEMVATIPELEELDW